jgi:hypothetical protein
MRRNLARLAVSVVDSRERHPWGAGKREFAPAGCARRILIVSLQSIERGTFIFAGLEPGEYSLVVSTSYKLEEAAHRKVRIDQADVSMNLQTNTGAKVSGRVIVDGQPATGGPGLPNVGVFANSPPRTYGVKYSEQPVFTLKGTDRFELTGLRGPLMLSANVTYGALVSIQRGGEDLAWRIIDFAGTETLDDVVVELTTRWHAWR